MITGVHKIAKCCHPVLIDHGGKVAQQFGLTFEMDDTAKNVLKSSGLDLEKRNADGRWILPVPGTFVIDRSGHIAYAHVDADYRAAADCCNVPVTTALGSLAWTWPTR